MEKKHGKASGWGSGGVKCHLPWIVPSQMPGMLSQNFMELQGINIHGFFRDLGSSTGRREFQGASMEKGHCEENSKVFSMKKKDTGKGIPRFFPWKRDMRKKIPMSFHGKGRWERNSNVFSVEKGM